MQSQPEGEGRIKSAPPKLPQRHDWELKMQLGAPPAIMEHSASTHPNPHEQGLAVPGAVMIRKLGLK